MRSQLKKIEPLKSLAKIIDQNFQTLDRIQITLEEIVRALSAGSAREAAILSAITRAYDAIGESMAANADNANAIRSATAATAGATRSMMASFSGMLLALQEQLARIEEGQSALSRRVDHQGSTDAESSAETRAAVAALSRDLQAQTAGISKATDALAGVDSLLRGLSETIAQINRPVRLGREDFDNANPEIGLLQYLYSFLSSRTALDIGANVGEVSERLLAAGYDVYAFEPHPDVYAKLVGRLGGSPDFHAFDLAIGPADDRMELHTTSDTSPDHKYGDVSLYSSLVRHSTLDDLPFTGRFPVTVRSVESLQNEGLAPKLVGAAKIDAEGFDLEVIRGLGPCRPEIVMSEFWDKQMIFGQSGALNALSDLTSAMRRLGYHWHIVVSRSEGDRIGFYCNSPRSIPFSWGNALFFRERNLFTEAREWCSHVLSPVF